MLYKDEYRPAPVTGDNSFIVNIGKLVDDLIDNEVPSVKHRVAEVDYDRYSITYFLGPQLVSEFNTISCELKIYLGKEVGTGQIDLFRQF